MQFTERQAVDRLTSAAQLAEATFLKLKPVKLEERLMVVDAIEELGKALAVAHFVEPVGGRNGGIK